MERVVAVGDEVDEFPAAGTVRRLRRIADLSQRELAREAGVSQAAVSRIEAGVLRPSVALLRRLLAVAGLLLVVVDEQGQVVEPMADWDDTRDGAERRYPSHLDTIVDPEPGEWWGDKYGLMRPPETFRRDRPLRDMQRARSQWEVRVAKCRFEPPPPDPWLRPWREYFANLPRVALSGAVRPRGPGRRRQSSTRPRTV